MTTTASRSRDYMRKLGYTAECVEHRRGMFIRVDLFGFADVMAYKPGNGILLIQAYRESKLAENEKKCHIQLNPIENKKIMDWILAGGKFEHHVWKCRQKGGMKKWSVERKEVKIIPGGWCFVSVPVD